MSYVAGFLEEQGFELDIGYRIDIPLFLQFLLEILQHQSLTVSIPVLHTWSRLLVTGKIANSDIVTSLIGPLLEICMRRLVRWESVPEESEDPIVTFLHADIDTIPERHAFVGNYRRYCASVIETIVQKRPHEAIPHILSTVDRSLSNLYADTEPFSGTFNHKQGVSTANFPSCKFQKVVHPAHACRHPVLRRRGDSEGLSEMDRRIGSYASRRCKEYIFPIAQPDANVTVLGTAAQDARDYARELGFGPDATTF